MRPSRRRIFLIDVGGRNDCPPRRTLSRLQRLERQRLSSCRFRRSGPKEVLCADTGRKGCDERPRVPRLRVIRPRNKPMPSSSTPKPVARVLCGIRGQSGPHFGVWIGRDPAARLRREALMIGGCGCDGACEGRWYGSVRRRGGVKCRERDASSRIASSLRNSCDSEVRQLLCETRRQIYRDRTHAITPKSVAGEDHTRLD